MGELLKKYRRDSDGSLGEIFKKFVRLIAEVAWIMKVIKSVCEDHENYL